MMTLANYGIKSSKYKDPVSAKSLNKSLQIRNRAESSLKHCLRTFHKVPEDKRIAIIDSIDEYYSRVPFNVVIWNKNQTKQCVVDSVLLLDTKFNPYKARDAFRTLERMLMNLVYLPWHKEFTKVVTYSGGFRSHVSDPLVGAEDLLKAAGFEQESNERPLHLVLPPNRMPQVDGSEHVTHVIFDCMLAQVIMTDIISVFESCCKASKSNPSKLTNNNNNNNSEINCYSWIQSYFRERSHQVNEKACTSIQELLNNITNHMTRQKLTSVKSSKLETSTNDRVGELSHPKKETSDNQESKSTLLMQRSIDNAIPFKLSDDLLKIPNYREPENLTANISHHQNHSRTEESRMVTQPIIFYRNEVSQPHQVDFRDYNKASSQQHLQQSIHNVGYAPKSRESFDMIDHHQLVRHSPMANETAIESNHDNAVPLLRTELNTHNDRELLIPRREKKHVIAQVHQDPGQPLVRDSYLNDVLPGGYGNSFKAMNDASTNNRSFNGSGDAIKFKSHSTTSQMPSTASKSASSRYTHNDSVQYPLKYDERESGRTYNSRMYWSCRSCTFLNHKSNEICEMCRDKKPL